MRRGGQQRPKNQGLCQAQDNKSRRKLGTPTCIGFAQWSQLVKILNAAGYSRVTAFGNGKAALAAIQLAAKQAASGSQPLDRQLTLLISDIEMPQMDGLALCQTVKLEMKRPLPVIMFSSLINDQVAKKCQAVGADAWASKPQTQKLLELVDGFCLPKTVFPA